jgi:hypothetical protein
MHLGLRVREYVYVYVYAYVYAYVYVHAYPCLCACVRVCVYVRLCVRSLTYPYPDSLSNLPEAVEDHSAAFGLCRHKHLCARLRVRVCMCVFVCVCVYMCMRFFLPRIISSVYVYLYVGVCVQVVYRCVLICNRVAPP